jgi:acetyl esterase/lipase
MDSIPTSTQIQDVTYRIHDTGALLARLYIPDEVSSSTKAIVSVHGGRWCDETRLTNTVIDQYLANLGIFVMAIDFRMPPSFDIQSQLQIFIMQLAGSKKMLRNII